MLWVSDFTSQILSSFRSFGVKDIADLFLIWFLLFKSLSFIRRVGAFKVFLGGLIFIVLSFVAYSSELVTLSWLLEKIYENWVILVVVLFQSEIKQLLAKVGGGPFFLSKQKKKEGAEIAEEISHALFKLAEFGQGALVVFERGVGLDYFVESGVSLDAKVSEELLLSLFESNSPLHDGAVIVRGQKLSDAGCVLPLSKNSIIDRSLGTRHRAAIGISEKTDAFVLVVSEELKQVSLVLDGQMKVLTDEFSIREAILENLFTETRKDV